MVGDVNVVGERRPDHASRHAGGDGVDNHQSADAALLGESSGTSPARLAATASSSRSRPVCGMMRGFFVGEASVTVLRLLLIVG